MKNIFSYSIIIGISGLIISSSFWVMKISLEKNNWQLLSKIYSSNTAVALSPNEEKANLVEDNNLAVKDNCPYPIETKTENSLVDYLRSQKSDTSFLARTELAKQFNIKNYYGGSSQNLYILRKLQEQQYPCGKNNLITPTLINLNLVNNL